MIEVKNIKKVFNKGKLNEIKAIKETTLTFPNKGLVVIVGPSGSGKTTLLNVLGGLETIDSGEIQFGDEVITKRSTRKLDEIRNQRIGYIFQQYNLLPNLTVYQNIELVLKMLGIKDIEEIEKRIDFCLEMTGMTLYKNRKIVALSGGQQQRVGIARAIAKNPDIIIADEPTGNLDSRNTVDIMNIIKKISMNKLVILVTHEQEIAHFYADRIIEIKDGLIDKDFLNEHQNSLDIRHNHTVYLKDLKQNELSSEPYEIIHYQDEEKLKEKIKITLVTQNDSIYIKVDGIDPLKVRFIDQQSEIKLINEHYKGLEQTDVNEVNFDLSQMTELDHMTLKKGSAITFKDAFKYAWMKLRSYTKIQKLLFLGFVFSAMMTAVALALLGKVYHVVPAEFQRYDKHYLLTDASYDDLQTIDTIDFINPVTDPVGFGIHIKQFYQIDTYIPVQAHPTPFNLLREKDLVYGSYPQNDDEVVIDKQALSVMMKSSTYKQTGITSYKEILGLELGSDALAYNKPLKIVGISNTHSPSIYMSENHIYEIAINRNIGTKLTTEENLTIIEGRLPQIANEVLFPIQFNSTNDYQLDDAIPVNGGTHLTIVGFYQKDYLSQIVLITNKNLIKETYYNGFYNNSSQLVYTTKEKNTINAINQRGHQVENTYEKNLVQYKKDIKQGFYTIIIFSVVLLSISLLQLYFIIRSSLLSRIYDIGVYRALGASKWDVQKMFVIEIAMVTSFTSLVGYIIMTLILKEVIKVQPIPIFYFPFYLIALGILLIYAVNILSGIYPVYRLTKKSPSQILKQYDA